MISKIRGFFRYFYSVPWCVPAWGWKEFASTVKALTTGALVDGPSADRFAVAVRDYLGMKFALPVNRGRTAIEIGLRAMGIGAGDDVLLPSFLCRSVLDSVLNTGARPVFADIGRDLNVTAASVEASLTPRTKCVIVAHLFGAAAAVDEIEALLATRGIALMDDAAQALGARRGDRLVGSFGACGIVSCGPGKPLAGAAGGLLLTNDERLYERASAIRLEHEPSRVVASRAIQFWMWRRFRRYTLPFALLLERLSGATKESGHVKATLSNLDGAIALDQLERLHDHAANRRRNGQRLLVRLSMLPAKSVTDFSSSAIPVKLVYVLPERGLTVQEAVEILSEHGIEAEGGYSPLHTSYADDTQFPYTAAVWRRVLCVPLETRTGRSNPIPFQQPSQTPASVASRLSGEDLLFGRVRIDRELRGPVEILESPVITIDRE
jgi:dTDP-4-amino-4,6-dideoxygalactose transaminase